MELGLYLELCVSSFGFDSGGEALGVDFCI